MFKQSLEARRQRCQGPKGRLNLWCVSDTSAETQRYCARLKFSLESHKGRVSSEGKALKREEPGQKGAGSQLGCSSHLMVHAGGVTRNLKTGEG